MNKIDKQEKWIKEYIEEVDISKIEWILLNSDELKNFFLNNYYDDEYGLFVKEFCETPIEIPIGMFYLSFNYINNDFKYLLGIIPNNIGKKTILGCLMYLDECYLFTDQIFPVTYLLSVEVNSYFRNKGVFKKMAEKFIGCIDTGQYIVVSKQSDIGKKCKVFETIDNMAKEFSFKKEVLYNDSISNDKLREKVCGEYVYKK